jgi:hypothetical protein
MAKDQATVFIKRRSLFKDNLSIGSNSGGAVCTHDQSRTYISEQTHFLQNNSTGSGMCFLCSFCCWSACSC